MGTVERRFGGSPGELAGLGEAQRAAWHRGRLAGLTGQGEGESGPFAGFAVKPYLSAVLIDHFFAKG